MEQVRPLAGIRVLEIGAYISAPYAASLLQSLGADVVKVERPGGEDFRRGLGSSSTFFRQYNAGKRSLAIDLKSQAGVALIRDLIPRFDVVLENMRPGKAKALGLDASECRELRPDLVYASVTGFGPGGPLADRPAYDTIGQSYGALYSILNDEGSERLSGTCLADLATGLTTVAGILAALVSRSRSGQGVHVETSIMEAVSTLTVDALTQFYDAGHRNPTRQSRHPQGQGFVVKTASGESLVVHLSSSHKFWLAMLDAIERPDLAEDPRFSSYHLREQHYFDLVPLVEAAFLTRPYVDWEARLNAHDVPFAPVLTVSGFIEHPQVKWLELLEDEADGVALIRPPWRFDGMRGERRGPVPAAGEHTRQIAEEVCSRSVVDALLEQGVLFEHLSEVGAGAEPARIHSGEVSR